MARVGDRICKPRATHSPLRLLSPSCPLTAFALWARPCRQADGLSTRPARAGHRHNIRTASYLPRRRGPGKNINTRDRGSGAIPPAQPQGLRNRTGRDLFRRPCMLISKGASLHAITSRPTVTTPVASTYMVGYLTPIPPCLNSTVKTLAAHHTTYRRRLFQHPPWRASGQATTCTPHCPAAQSMACSGPRWHRLSRGARPRAAAVAAQTAHILTHLTPCYATMSLNIHRFRAFANRSDIILLWLLIRDWSEENVTPHTPFADVGGLMHVFLIQVQPSDTLGRFVPNLHVKWE